VAFAQGGGFQPTWTTQHKAAGGFYLATKTREKSLRIPRATRAFLTEASTPLGAKFQSKLNKFRVLQRSEDFEWNRFSARLLLNCIVTQTKVKRKQAERLRKNRICGPQGLKPLMNPMRLRRG
jgi:hypothetical protein